MTPPRARRRARQRYRPAPRHRRGGGGRLGGLVWLGLAVWAAHALGQGLAGWLTRLPDGLALPAPPATRPTAGAPAPSRTAHADIPPAYLRLYQQAARDECPGLAWTVLAGIGKVESDHGRARLPGVRSGWNHAGAAGPMQFGIGRGRAGNAWARYGHDGDSDGRVNVYDPADAIPAAARYLCDHGAPKRLRQAVYAYNHSWAYVATVLGWADRYAQQGGGRR